MNNKELIKKLMAEHSLTLDEYEYLIDRRDPDLAKELAAQAVSVRRGIYGNAVYTRGLIEISNICKITASTAAYAPETAAVTVTV